MSSTTSLEPNKMTSVEAPLATPEPTQERCSPRLLLHGLDTVQCCYYLTPRPRGGIDCEWLGAQRERLRAAQKIRSEPITVGGQKFMLAPNGSLSGYPFVISNRDWRIEFGPHNKPPFFVTFRSEALWRNSIQLLQQQFLDWALGLGYAPVHPEKLTRVDFSFDYFLPALDFDEDSFVSQADKDHQHRENGRLQTFTFGKGDVVLRVYDKVAEIRQQSGKVWLFKLWGEQESVWRIEWQCRKAALKRFGIETLDDLDALQGDLLRWLAKEHTTLRVQGSDGNRSRWPLHPLWIDLRQQIALLEAQGVYRVDGRPAALNEQRQRLAISVYGYLKHFAAIRAVQQDIHAMPVSKAILELSEDLKKLHDELTWRLDVSRRIKEIELGAR